MKKIAYIFGFGCFLFLTSCGSSSSPAATTTEDTVEVSDLSVLPNLDLDSADTTSASFSALPPTKSVEDGESTAGSVATSGCMAVNYLKPVALAQLKQIETYKCYIKTTQDGHSEVVPGSDDYAYYAISGIEGGQSLRVRVGNFTSDSTSTFKMDVCESADGSTFSRTTEFSIAGNTTDKTWSGFATTHFSFPEDGQFQTPAGDTVTSAFNNSTFTITMSSGDDLSAEYDASKATHIETTTTFGRNPSTADVTDATTYLDGFQVSFEKETTTDFSEGVLNSVVGTFGDGDIVSGTMYSQFTKAAGALGRGAAKFEYTNSVMSQSNFESAEAFSLSDPEDDGDVTATVVNEAGADYTALFATAEAQVLSALTLSIPDGINSEVAFDVSWDCTDASGGTSNFTAVDVSGVDFAACDALAQEVADGSSKDNSSCFGGGGGGDDMDDDTDDGGSPITELSEAVGTYSGGTSTCPGVNPSSITVAVSGSTVTMTMGVTTFTGTGSLSADFLVTSQSGGATVSVSNFVLGTLSLDFAGQCTLTGYTKQ